MKNNLQEIKLSRSQKILLALHELAGNSKKQIRFEDIAVKVYEMFKADFQLRGYPQYPDTGDIVHKPLYSDLKRNGYVLSGNKYFSLTPKGIEYAKTILKHGLKGNLVKKSDDNYVKFTIDQQKEIERIMESAAFNLYSNNKEEEIIDIDFYSYLGVTVRTAKNDFLGRIATVEDAIRSTKNKGVELYKQLSKCHAYLLEKFKENIEYVKNSKGGKR